MTACVDCRALPAAPYEVLCETCLSAWDWTMEAPPPFAPVAAEPSASAGAVVGEDAGSGQVGTVVRLSTNPLTREIERLEAERAEVTVVREGDGWRLTVWGATAGERVEVLLGCRGGQ